MQYKTKKDEYFLKFQAKRVKNDRFRENYANCAPLINHQLDFQQVRYLNHHPEGESCQVGRYHVDVLQMLQKVSHKHNLLTNGVLYVLFGADSIEREQLYEPLILHRLKPEQIKQVYDGLLNDPAVYTGVVLDWIS